LASISLVLVQRASALPLLALAALLFSASATAAASMIFALLAIRVPEDRRSTTLNLVYLPLYLAGIIGGSLGSILVQGGLNRPLLAGAPLVLGAVVLALRPAAGRGFGGEFWVRQDPRGGPRGRPAPPRRQRPASAAGRRAGSGRPPDPA